MLGDRPPAAYVDAGPFCLYDWHLVTKRYLELMIPLINSKRRDVACYGRHAAEAGRAVTLSQGRSTRPQWNLAFMLFAPTAALTS